MLYWQINIIYELKYFTFKFAGGFPDNESIQKRTENRFTKPFIGCLQEISFGNDESSRIQNFTAYRGVNIGSCDLYDDFSNV